MTALTVHPKGNRARILLSSVFGPYAQNDEYGSRALNPMELYQNQVTRTQGGVFPSHVSSILWIDDASGKHRCTLYTIGFSLS